MFDEHRGSTARGAGRRAAHELEPATRRISRRTVMFGALGMAAGSLAGGLFGCQSQGRLGVADQVADPPRWWIRRRARRAARRRVWHRSGRNRRTCSRAIRRAACGSRRRLRHDAPRAAGVRAAPPVACGRLPSRRSGLRQAASPCPRPRRPRGTGSRCPVGSGERKTTGSSPTSSAWLRCPAGDR